MDKIHSLPFLVLVEWAFIYLPILYHTVYGIWITFTGQPNVGLTPTGRTGFTSSSGSAPWSSWLFMVFHVLA